MLLIVIFSSLLAGFALALPSAQKRDDGSLLTSEIDDFILSVLTEWGSPGGVAVAAVKMNEDATWSVDTRGYGMARSDGSLVDSETMFAIGSNSKVILVFVSPPDELSGPSCYSNLLQSLPVFCSPMNR